MVYDLVRKVINATRHKIVFSVVFCHVISQNWKENGKIVETVWWFIHRKWFRCFQLNNPKRPQQLISVCAAKVSAPRRTNLFLKSDKWNHRCFWSYLTKFDTTTTSTYLLVEKNITKAKIYKSNTETQRVSGEESNTVETQRSAVKNEKWNFKSNK